MELVFFFGGIALVVWLIVWWIKSSKKDHQVLAQKEAEIGREADLKRVTPTGTIIAAFIKEKKLLLGGQVDLKFYGPDEVNEWETFIDEYKNGSKEYTLRVKVKDINKPVRDIKMLSEDMTHQWEEALRQTLGA